MIKAKLLLVNQGYRNIIVIANKSTKLVQVWDVLLQVTPTTTHFLLLHEAQYFLHMALTGCEL